MWESLIGSTLAPAIQAGVGEAAVGAITPTLEAGLDQALTGMLPSQLGNATAGLGMDSVFQALGQTPMFTADGMLIPTIGNIGGNAMTNAGVNAIANPMTQGMTDNNLFDTLKGYGKALTSDQATNAMQAGGGLFNIYNQSKALGQAKNIQDQQMEMNKDAYNREKSADERRQKLVF